MPRKRQEGHDLPPNLYPNKRDSVTYYRWKDPRNGDAILNQGSKE